jgi:hypothetical protein
MQGRLFFWVNKGDSVIDLQSLYEVTFDKKIQLFMNLLFSCFIIQKQR